jgi:hypothetical protein
MLRLSRGRLSTGMGQTYVLLHVRGAKSSIERTIPLLATKSGDAILLVASKRERLWAAVCGHYSGYAAYQARTRWHVIPVVILESRSALWTRAGQASAGSQIGGSAPAGCRSRRLPDPLVDADVDGVARPLADRLAELRLDGQPVRAVPLRHERAVERLAVDHAADLHEPARAEELRRVVHHNARPRTRIVAF